MDTDMNNGFADPAFYDFTGSLGATGGQSNHNRIVSLDSLTDIPTTGPETNSGQLVRRNPNQQLAARRRNPWEISNDPQSEWNAANAEDDDEELEQKALLAKKERKAIPPFVQKLSR
jgi:heat shock transcription factor